MILAVISDVVWQALIAAVLAGFIEWMRRNTLKKVEEVKAVAQEIHKLTNGNMGEQLKIGMIAAQTLANTKPTVANKQLAKAATEKYQSHLASEEAPKLKSL